MRRFLTLTAVVVVALVAFLVVGSLPTVDAVAGDMTVTGIIEVALAEPGIAPTGIFDSKMGDYLAFQPGGYPHNVGSRGQPVLVPGIYFSGTYATHGYPIGHGTSNLRI